MDRWFDCGTKAPRSASAIRNGSVGGIFRHAGGVRPARVTGLLPIVVIGLMVNAASVFYIIFMPNTLAPTLVNAVVCVVYSFAVHKANAEVMR